MLRTNKKLQVLKVTILLAFLLPISSLTLAGITEERSVAEFQEGMSELHSEAAKPGASKELKELSDTLRKTQENKRDYEKHKLNAWVYTELAKCNSISDKEFEEYFIRYVKSKYPNLLSLVYSDANTENVYADRFIKEEYMPKARDYYLDVKKCPKLKELNFGF
jgi:hypothetical protein